MSTKLGAIQPANLSSKELHQSYSLSESELEWLSRTAKSPVLTIGLAVLLKAFQQLHYFPALEEIPAEIINHVRLCLSYGARIAPRYANPRTLYRHQTAIRQHLQIASFYGSDALKITTKAAHKAVVVLDQRVDVINVLIGELLERGYELPAYSTLNDAAEDAQVALQDKIFNQVVDRAPIDVIYRLRELLDTDFGRRQSDFNTLKQVPKKPSRKHLEILIDHLSWLEGFGDLDAIFEGIVDTKIWFFANQAEKADVSELKETPNKLLISRKWAA